MLFITVFLRDAPSKDLKWADRSGRAKVLGNFRKFNELRENANGMARQSPLLSCL
jgi:hypothetical protein